MFAFECLHYCGVFKLGREDESGALKRISTHLPGIVHRGKKGNASAECKTNCEMAVGMKAFFESLASGPTKYMIFGGACETVTAPIAEAVHFWNLVQLSYADTTPSLSNRNKYPHFFRTVPSEADIGAARIRLFHFFNWTKIATIHQDIGQHSYAQNKQVKMALDNNIQLLAQESFNDDPTNAVLSLKKSQARIIIGFFKEEVARRVFCQVYRQELYGANYVWLLPGYFSDRWWRTGENNSDCTSEELGKALEGYIATEILPISSSEERTISDSTPSQYEFDYDLKRREDQKDEYSIYHGYAYDGIWVMALAIDNVINTLKTRAELHRFENFDYHDEEMLDLFSRAMNETNFRGVTGIVQFKDGERMGSTMHKQLQGTKLVKVAEYYSITDSLNTTTGDTDPFRWQGENPDVPPQDWPLVRKKLFTVSIVLFFIMASIASAGIVMAMGFFFFNMKHRNQRYIKMSSPYLNNLILFGGILTYMSVYFLGMDMGLISEDAFQAVCAARAWFLCLGFSFSFGAMFGKTWRVHKIFTNIKMKKKVIKDHQLFLLVGVLVIIDLLLLVLWQSIDPLKPVKNKQEPRPDPTGEDVIIYPIVYNCDSDKKMIWLASIYIYKGVLMIFGLFLAWETRHVSIPALNDSKYIGMSVYNVVIMCVLGVSLSAIIQDDLNASYGLVSIFILFCTTITLCLVFVPKVIELRVNPNANERIRVMGTLDKSCRTASTTVNSMDSDTKMKILSSEQIDLKKKLEEKNKKISELEEKLHSVAPEEASLLLNEELRTDDTLNSTNLSVYSRATEVSRISAFPSIQGGIKVCVQEPSSDQSNRNSSSSQGRSKFTAEMDDDEKSEFYTEFGGVYLGPPNSNPKSGRETESTSDMLSPNRPRDQNVAQVHRSFEDEDSFFDIGPQIEVDLPSTQHLKNEFEMKTLGGNELSVPVPVFNGSLLD